MADLLFVVFIVGSVGVLGFGLLVGVRQMFIDPRQLPWIVWPTLVLLAILLLGRWAKHKPGTPRPRRESIRGRIQAAASATKSSPFTKSATSLAFVVLVSAILLGSFSLVSVGTTILAIGLLVDFVWTVRRNPKVTADGDQA